MLILIQNCETHDYFSHGGWTSQIECAQHFESSAGALQFIYDNKLDPVQIVLKLGDPKYDLQVAKSKGC